MAKLNGIEIRHLKSFTGHDGETLYQGDIFLNGKEIASWSQDAWNGPDHYRLAESCRLKQLFNLTEDCRIEQLLDDAAKKLHPEEKNYNLDILIWDALILTLMEKDFEKNRRKKLPVTVIFNNKFCDYIAFGVPEMMKYCPDNELVAGIKKESKKQIFEELFTNSFNDIEAMVCRASKDFIKGEPIVL